MSSLTEKSCTKCGTVKSASEFNFDAFVVEEAYNLIVKRRDATGMDWQLDHIVPIAGRLVCGLHVGANLQLLPAALNNFKRNRYDPNTLSAVRTGLFVGV